MCDEKVDDVTNFFMSDTLRGIPLLHYIFLMEDRGITK